MNAHATSACHVAHHVIARYRLTALRVAHQQAIRTLNTNALPGPPHAIDNARQRTRLRDRFRCIFELRMQRLDHLHHVHIASPDRRDQVRRVLQLQRPRDRQQCVIIRLRQSTTPKLPLDDFASESHGRRALFETQHLADLVSRATRADMGQPIPTGLGVRISQDLDGFRVFELAGQWCNTTVDLRARAARTHLRMHGERKIEWRGSLGQLDNVARWREYENLILIQVELEELQEFTRRLGVELQLQHLTKPREVSIEFVGVLTGLLVQPVRRDAEVGRAMHVAGANLDLEQLSARTEHRGMQRLVAVRLWLCDVVLDALLHRRPAVVNYPQRVIALEDVRHDHANGQQVVDILVRSITLLHLLEDRPQMLWPPRNVHVSNAGVGEALLQRLAHLCDQRLPLPPFGRHHPGQRFVCFRFEMLERQIFQLPPHLCHAETVCQRRIQVARFLRDTSALLSREPVERPHVVESISQLDQDDPRVLGDREQQLAIVLDLSLLTRRQWKIGNLREPVHDLRDLRTELPFDILDGDVGVLHDVMQQAAGDGRRIQMQIGQNTPDFHTMRHIRFAGMPHLTRMRRIRETIGANEQLVVELLVRAVGTRTESGNHVVQRNRRHSSPASAKLMYRPRPTMMWSCTGISSKRPAATNCAVTTRSSADGVGSPLG